MRCLLICSLIGLLATTTALADDTPAAGGWVNISDPVVKQLAAEGKKQDWPYQTAGVACDALSGDVFVVLPGQGLWKSADRGATFARVDGGAVGGRCETSFSLNADPAGKRLACFMLDGKCAMTGDGGKTWQPFTDLGRNWDYAAVDWSGESVRNILGERHEVGGEVYLSNDGGKSWKLLFKDAAFDRAGGLGIFDASTLVRAWPGRGIERSKDAGVTWTKVSDYQPNGRVMKVNRTGTAYWLGPAGLLASRDKGLTWRALGTSCPGSIGPLFDPADERHLAVAGADGIFETRDEGRTWTKVSALPDKFDVPKPGGWFTNVAWDPAADVFYASRMGFPTYRLERKMATQGGAAEPRAGAADVNAAIDLGLGFLAKDALAWKAEHNCASCHHAALVAWSMREAKGRGHAVDEPVLAEMAKWVANSGDGKFRMDRPPAAPNAFSPKAVWFALALGADPQPDTVARDGMKRLLGTVKSEQTENGSWQPWPQTRPPMFGSSQESMTALAALALIPATAKGDDVGAKVALDRAVRWLAATKSDDDPQSVALRLVLWQRLNRPADGRELLVRQIKRRQNADGGWSQSQEMPSDAWATGQALYALADEHLAPDDPAIARGRAFLVRTQRPDGSWLMTSRPTAPGDKGAKLLVPITGAGSAWAVLGLVRTR